MGVKVPWGDIPDFSMLPKGIYQLAIKALEPYNKQGNNKLIVKGTFEAIEPDSFAGMTFREYFTIGSDEDPEAEDPETWKRTSGSRKLTRILKKANVDLAEELDDTCANAPGAEFMASVEVEEQAEGEYAGRKNNRIGSVYEAGSMDPVILEEGAKPAKKPALKPVAKAPAPAPARRPVRMVDPAPPAEDEEVEEIEEEEEEAPRRVSRPPVGGRARR